MKNVPCYCAPTYWLREESPLTHHERLVLVALYYDQESATTLTHIKAITGLSKRKINWAISGLISKGALETRPLRSAETAYKVIVPEDAP